MALLLEKSIFYHVPKTGGTWVGKVLEKMNMVKNQYIETKHPRGELNLTFEHISPLYADPEVVAGKFSFAFVRNPITWYQSFWKYKQANSGWDEPYLRYQDDNFNKFMRKIMDMCPSFLSRVYQEFDDVDFMGRQENLRNDLITILETVGETFDPEIISEEPTVNVSPIESSDSSFSCQYDPDILKEMKEKEKWIFNKYYMEEI